MCGGRYAADAHAIFCEGRWAEVAPDEKVLTITCDDGAQFPLLPGVRGRVLELGSRLTHTDLSTRAGYVLILQSSAKEVARLLGEEVPPR